MTARYLLERMEKVVITLIIYGWPDSVWGPAHKKMIEAITLVKKEHGMLRTSELENMSEFVEAGKEAEDKAKEMEKWLLENRVIAESFPWLK